MIFAIKLPIFSHISSFPFLHHGSHAKQPRLDVNWIIGVFLSLLRWCLNYNTTPATVGETQTYFGDTRQSKNNAHTRCCMHQIMIDFSFLPFAASNTCQPLNHASQTQVVQVTSSRYCYSFCSSVKNRFTKKVSSKNWGQILFLSTCAAGCCRIKTDDRLLTLLFKYLSITACCISWDTSCKNHM